jgi:hypothetical protein
MEKDLCDLFSDESSDLVEVNVCRPGMVWTKCMCCCLVLLEHLGPCVGSGFYI